MGIIRFIGKVIALLLLVVFLAVLPVTVWTFNIGQALLDPATYQHVLQSRTLYRGVLPALLPRMMNNLQDSPDAPSDAEYAEQVFANLTQEDWQTIIGLLMPAPWLKQQMQDNLDSFFEWVEGPEIRPRLALDLTEFKRRLRGQEGREVVEVVVSSWPTCSESEMEQMQRVLMLGSEVAGPLPTCQPASSLEYQALIEGLGQAIALTADELPDQVSLNQALSRSISPEETASWLTAKLVIRVVRRVAYLIFLLPLVILLLIEIVVVRSLRSLLKWFGWALFLGGLLSLSLPIDLLILALRQTALRRQVLFLITELITQASQSILLQGGIITLAGLVCLVVASLITAMQGRQGRVRQAEGTGGAV